MGMETEWGDEESCAYSMASKHYRMLLFRSQLGAGYYVHCATLLVV